MYLHAARRTSEALREAIGEVIREGAISEAIREAIREVISEAIGEANKEAIRAKHVQLLHRLYDLMPQARRKDGDRAPTTTPS